MDKSATIDASVFVSSASTYICGAPSTPASLMEKLSSFHGLQLYTAPPAPSYLKEQADSIQTKEGDIPFIPSGGLTRRILQSLGPEWPIPFFALLHFVFEGDNRGDAGILAALVNQVLNLELKSKLPPHLGLPV